MPLAHAQTASALSNPLAAPDTSSPRSTLRSFIDAVDGIYQIIQMPDDTPQASAHIRHSISSTLTCLDLGEIAPALVQSKGTQAVACLKEVFDRIEVPPFEMIPDAATVRADGLKRWRVPGTEITLICLAAGPRAGEFVFSAETVLRADEFYERVKHLPYKANASTPGLHDAYEQMSGRMIPKWLIRSLPAWARVSLWGEAAWQWLATLIVIATSFLVVLLGFRLSLAASRPGSRLFWLRRLIAFIFPLAIIGSSLVADFLLTSQIRLTGELLFILKICLRVVMFTGVITAVFVGMKQLSDLLIHTRGLRPDTIDSQLVRLGCQISTFLAITGLVIAGADSMGISIAPLIAGLGVGGLAVALASQHTIENLIAGIVLFADKPVRIGDDCQFGSICGKVEQIGLRSTRIRGADRTVISVPNSEFAKLQLVNFSRRDQILLKAILNLDSTATATQLRVLIPRLQAILLDHPRIANEPARARLIAHTASSLDVEIFAFVLTSNTTEFLAVQEEVLLCMMDAVAQVGCAFAASSKTLCLVREDVHSSDIPTRAESTRDQASLGPWQSLKKSA